MGRPRLPSKDALGENVMVRLSPQRRKVYEREARREKMKLSGWIRVACDEKIENNLKEKQK